MGIFAGKNLGGDSGNKALRPFYRVFFISLSLMIIPSKALFFCFGGGGESGGVG